MTTGTDTFQPIIDPETGEVIAESEQDRRELIEDYAAWVIDAAKAERRAAVARARLRLLMRPGDAVPVDGWAITCKPGTAPRRAVVPHAMDGHEESLAAIPGCAIREETVTRRVYPGVSDLTKARDALARVGLTPEDFMHAGEPGESKIVVVPPEGE